MKFLLICILLLSYPLMFFRFLFYQYMVVFLFNIVIYVLLLKEFIYSYCCLCTCILIVRPCILIVVYVFLLLSVYSYCSSMYSYRCLCILIVVHVFLEAATLTEVYPCFFLSCKANARVQLAKTGHGPHSSNCCVVLCIVCLASFCVLFVCKSVLLPPGDNPIAVNTYIIYHNVFNGTVRMFIF